MKLSKAQQRVVDKMREGWELVRWLDYNPTAHIQLGNNMRTVSTATAYVLCKNKVVVEISKSHTRHVYKLSPEWEAK